MGSLDDARAASAELAATRDAYGQSGWLAASAAHAAGAIDLAAGDPWAALASLRRARSEWQELEAPYEDACARVLVGLACRAVGDEDTAGLELEAARRSFASLGAATDLARVETLLAGAAPPSETHGLSPRELEVLRLVAAGRSNREIAAELVHQRAHRRPPPPEHLRQAARLLPHRRRRVRVRARAGLTGTAAPRRMVRIDHPRARPKLVRAGDAARSASS